MIKGLQRVSIIDFPKRICSVIFTGGCNFRCPYCHNPELVVDWEKLPTISEEEILTFLNERRGLIDGVCITGGEPTLHNTLPHFIEKVVSSGFRVKLDTNGSIPQMIEELLQKKLIDYIAMDIKAIPEKYDVASGVSVNISDIEKSIRIITEGKIEYEFRSTVFPDFISSEDGERLGKWLKGTKRFVLQRPRKLKMLLEVFKDRPTYAETELSKLRTVLLNYIDEVVIR